MLDADRQKTLLQTTILGTEGEQLLVDDPLNLAPVRSSLNCGGTRSANGADEGEGTART